MSEQASSMANESEMIDCGAAVRMLWDYLDGSLGPREVAAIQAHINLCSHCFSHADFGQVVLDAIAQSRQSQEVTSASALRERVVARLRADGYQEP